MCTQKGFLVPTTQHKHTTRNINKCKQQMRLNPKRLRPVIRVGLGSSDKCCGVEKLVTKPVIFERTTSHSKKEPAYSLERDLGSGSLDCNFCTNRLAMIPSLSSLQSYCKKKTDEMIILLKSQGWYH